MRTICSIFSKRLNWFSFGKEVASPTKIIRIVDLVLIFVEIESILVSFYC